MIRIVVAILALLFSQFAAQQACAQPVPQRAIIGAPAPGSRYLPPDERYFRHFNVSSAGFSGHIGSIVQDATGFLWVGTSAGLARFDGYEFTRPYEQMPLGGLLSTSYINGLAAAPAGWIAVATRGQGAFVIQPNHGRLNQITSRDPGFDMSLAYAVMFDGDVLWIGTESGLLGWSISQQKAIYQAALPPIHAILKLDDDGLLLGLDGGLMRHYPEDGRSERINGDVSREIYVVDSADGPLLERRYHDISNVLVNSLHRDHKNRIWFASEGGGIGYMLPSDDQLNLISYNTASELEFQHRWVYGITQPSNEEIWFAIPEGIEVVDLDSLKVVRHILHDPTLENGLKNSIARSVYTDSSGLVWVGGHDSFLHRYNPAGGAISTLRHTPLSNRFSTQSALSFPDIRSVFQDSKGLLWAGTSHFGVDIIDLTKGRIGNIPAEPYHPNGLNDATVHSISQSADGDIWIGGGNGIARFADMNTRRRFYRMADGLRDEFIRLLKSGPKGLMWAGTPNGLFIINPETDMITPAVEAKVDHLLNSASIRGISFGADGVAWIASDTGLFALDGNRQLIGHWQAGDGGLQTSRLTAVQAQADGRIWLTADSQLLIFDGLTFKPYQNSSEPSVVSSGPLYSDTAGVLWAYPYLLSVNNTAPLALGAHLGADVGTINPRAVVKLRDGHMAFGGSSGLLLVDENKLSPRAVQPRLGITGVLIDGVSESVTATKSLVLPPLTRSFSVEFANLEYTNPDSTLFAYRLIGYDDSWIETSASNRRATYTNLVPDSYVIEVKATDSFGQWSDRVLRKQVIILPAWYQTLWFRLSAALAGLVAFAGIYQVRMWQVRLQTKRLQVMVDKRTREIAGISDMSRELAATRDTNRIALVLHRQVQDLMPVHAIVLIMCEKAGAHVFYQEGLDQLLPAAQRTGDVVADLCPDYRSTHDTDSDDAPVIYQRAFNGFNLIALSLLAPDKDLGLLVVACRAPEEFSEKQIKIIAPLAAHTAVAISNGLGYQQLSEAHESLKNTQQQMVMQEKMASLGTLTAGVAHEINNPVSFTRVMVDKLAQKHQELLKFLVDLAGGDTADQEIVAALESRFDQLDDITQTAREGTQRITEIVRDLRTFTRLDQAEKQEVRLSEIITATIHLVRTKYIDIHFETDFRDDPKIECYSAKLSQVFLNIIVNGCDAILQRLPRQPEPAGKISISLKRVPTPEGRFLLRVTIADNGIGMTDEVAARIFEPFFTTKDVGEGTGLGLAISYGVVADHNGEITVSSALGGGSSFEISIPMSAP